MGKGALTVFCKDFDLKIPVQKIQEAFRLVQHNQEPLELDKFKLVLPKLGLEMAKSMRKEIKHRLRELKLILEYPVNNVKMPESLESAINDVDLSTYKLGRVPDFS